MRLFEWFSNTVVWGLRQDFFDKSCVYLFWEKSIKSFKSHKNSSFIIPQHMQIFFFFQNLDFVHTQIFKVSISAFNRSTCFCRLSSTGSTLTTDTLRRFSSFHVSVEVLIEKFNCLYLAACKIRLNSHSFLSLISAISPADFPRIFLADSSKMVIH